MGVTAPSVGDVDPRPGRAGRRDTLGLHRRRDPDRTPDPLPEESYRPGGFPVL
ncbi:hypothetical protein ACFY2T_08090 [Streptomyces sp. NPDC001260]|uniref:hypothetical protein n=1 Tax=Streptomyces sp. NPDC001260 TaxID=3364551 RepID=UPI00369E98B1